MAITTVDGLVDFKFVNTSHSESKKSKDGTKGNSLRDDRKKNSSQTKPSEGIRKI